MCNVCNVCNVLTNMPTWNNCKYATPLYFYRVNRIFFGFRAFYLFFIQILAVILHRNSKSSHVHRTFIALPSHTRTRVTAMRRSSSANARSSSLRLFQMRFARSRWLQEREIILVILLNFVLLIMNKIPKIKQD